MKNKKDHSEPRDLVLYKNLDTYRTPEGGGPGISFYQELYKFKSVQDYLNSKKKKKRKKKLRKKAFYVIAMGENFDSQVTPIPYGSEENVGPIGAANQIGGFTDQITQEKDSENRQPMADLDYEREREKRESIDSSEEQSSDDSVISPAESPPFGLPTTIDPEDIDQPYTNKGYGTTDSGNKSYNGVPFPTQES